MTSDNILAQRTRQHAAWVLLTLAAFGADAAPVFSATQHVARLSADLSWSSDLGVGVTDQATNYFGSAAPVTRTAVATRDGRTIGATITQTGPTVLAGQYWAGEWSGSIGVPGPGFYGLFASSEGSGYWNFEIPGQTPAENAATTFYYAAVWDVDAPADIHPWFDWRGGAGMPLSGSETGSFRLADFYAFGLPGFVTRPLFMASTYALDTNAPGAMDYRLRIAFATTPIDVGVFEPATLDTSGTLALVLGGTVAAALTRRRAAASGALRPGAVAS